MQNGPKTGMSTRQPKPAGSFAPRSKRWTPSSARPHRVSKRPTKLRAISRISPGGSAIGECRCGGELLSTRRTLFQIAVLEPRGDIERFVQMPVHCKRPTPTYCLRHRGKRARIDAALASDELIEGLRIRLVQRRVPHDAASFAPRPFVGYRQIVRPSGARAGRSQPAIRQLRLPK
jgi:hypothetical protein